ncbi:hypothetical protein ANCCEY_13152 [Ancylostoma ceylanicum]|uniref:G-protein coupled receptors family 1 profile domain-containing protein n=1 Tax=Ancylostoma ceylanicum TaxID=53326 RepID=A0A0D6L9F1_9BILA|nr:hypothetical protein ANCCEY_13152 [Ancylostoma ceylanicum]
MDEFVPSRERESMNKGTEARANLPGKSSSMRSINQRREGDVDENVRDDVGRSAGRRALLPHGRLRQRSGSVRTAGERPSGHTLLDKGELQRKMCQKKRGCHPAYLICLTASFGCGTASMMRGQKHSPFFFLGFVALFDTLFDATFILLLSVPVNAEYFDNYVLFMMWLNYMPILYLFSQIFKIASVFCLIMASIERCVETGIQ